MMRPSPLLQQKEPIMNKQTNSTAPGESHVAIVGTYRGTTVPGFLEYLTPDYVLENRVEYWTKAGWSDVHAAQQVIRYTRLTPEEAEAQRSR
jgi:hypothetical protein